ncbi:MAG: RNase adapter RapZ [Rickettsiales bacterium]|nr:RNase adapter RapZ [Rickettsiales bacterium]
MNLKKSYNKIIIITGLSGAGRSSALKNLEDLGFEAVDNLPFFLLSKILETKINKNLALGVDVRSRDFDSKKICSLIKSRKDKLELNTLFLDCEDDIILNRFKESRRPHPLKLDLPMQHIIQEERTRLEPLKKISDYYINTSSLSLALLKQKIERYFNINTKLNVRIRIISFGFKYGLPREADFVFDMRFIKNPFYDKNLKYLNGKNKKVINFVKKQKLFKLFSKNLEISILKLLLGFSNEGKAFVTIAFGCTGGIHRSVVSSEYFYKFLNTQKQFDVSIEHRDLKK